jgi:hypothetical protein
MASDLKGLLRAKLARCGVRYLYLHFRNKLPQMCSGGQETRTAGLGGGRLSPPHLSAKVWNAAG